MAETQKGNIHQGRAEDIHQMSRELWSFVAVSSTCQKRTTCFLYKAKAILQTHDFKTTV